MAIIHLGRPLPDGSSDLPGSIAVGFPSDRERATHIKCFPIWSCTTRSLPGRECYHHTPVSSYLTVSPITLAGWSVLCCTCRRLISQTPGRYPARCPKVFGLSSDHCW